MESFHGQTLVVTPSLTDTAYIAVFMTSSLMNRPLTHVSRHVEDNA